MTQLGRRSTAEDALRGQSLQGKRAIVTGASSGLGVETTRVLARAGAEVTMAVRNIAAGEQVKAQLGGAIDVRAIDLSDLDSVRAFAAAWGDRPIDLLVNNAGIMGPPLGVTAQGFESQMGTNHLGHFLLTTLLEPRLEPGARVVNLSSGLHRRGRGESVLATLDGDRRFERRKYLPQRQYGDSKLANVLFARGLAKRGVLAFSLHPGVIATNLTRTTRGAAIFKLVGKPFFKSVAQGAATTIYAATAPELAEKSGAYLSDCAVAEPLGEALDDALVERVWTLSERAVSSRPA